MASLMEGNKLGSYNNSCPKIVILESTMEMERDIFVLLKYFFFNMP